MENISLVHLPFKEGTIVSVRLKTNLSETNETELLKLAARELEKEIIRRNYRYE